MVRVADQNLPLSTQPAEIAEGHEAIAKQATSGAAAAADALSRRGDDRASRAPDQVRDYMIQPGNTVLNIAA